MLKTKVISRLEELYRNEYGRILAGLIRLTQDFTLAEDALQDAFAAALAQWPEQGVPTNPAGWLISTARHKAVDQIRRRALAENKREEMIAFAAGSEGGSADLLRLIFTCCHPALAPEAQVALTLRTVCGLNTEEIAQAFLAPVPTMAQRLVRAKTKIRLAGIPYVVPADEELPERLQNVLAVVYLVFNEGYSSSLGAGGPRADLCREAIRLGRQIVALLPREREPRGLLALMLLNDARRATRVDEAGELVLLENQQRSLWDRAQIKEGCALVEQALAGGPAGPYALQAAVAALHAQAPSFEATDWREIALLYGMLARIHPSAVVEINRAVAVAMAEGPEKGLALLNQITLPGYHLLPAARADLLRRLGRKEEAVSAYKEACALVRNDMERRFLQRRWRDLL